jgi:dihydrofolate synthase/folylpolyglutamate synthase
VNYEQAIAFLDGRIKFGMRPGTERVAALVEALGHPQRSYPVVQVSGTNAKFSVVSMVSALLQEMGLTVGTYTSPHLESVRERIALGGVPISEDELASTLTYLEPYLKGVEDDLGDQLTWFELLTGVAFEAFFDRAVHAAVLEVGLGGEYDATNVADAQVGVVTNVSLDHIRQFGRDLNKATWEKAGIAKEGTFLVSGIEQDDLFAIVDERARDRNALAVVRLDRDFELTDRQPAVGGQLVSISGVHGAYDEVFLSLFGSHQARNAALAVAACEGFAGEALNADIVKGALGAVRVPGRIEVLGRRPLVVCDGAHNIAASEAVVDAIKESFTFERLILVAGMVETKLVEEVLGQWAAIVDRAFVAALRSERSASPERLAAALEVHGVPSDRIGVCESVDRAVDAALDESNEDDLVLIFGSFYTVGEARAWLRSRGVLTQA